MPQAELAAAQWISSFSSPCFRVNIIYNYGLWKLASPLLNCLLHKLEWYVNGAVSRYGKKTHQDKYFSGYAKLMYK
jgi:hypothetical protein